MLVFERRDRVRASNVDLDVLVTLPEQPGRRPALLYLPALGTTTLECDFASATPSPLSGLLCALSKAGFVTLRTQPDTAEASLEQMLATHRASFAWLASLPEVDPERVFVFGHSLGGTLAPWIGTAVRGIVVYGAPSRAWSECMARSALRQLELFGLTGDVLAREAEAARQLYSLVFKADRGPAEVLADHPEIKASRAATDVKDNAIFDRDPRFYRALERLDLEAAWRRAGSVLALCGEHDWVVDSDDHLRIASWARDGRALTLAGLDHWMQRHATRAASFGRAGHGEVDPEWANPVVEWLLEEREETP